MNAFLNFVVNYYVLFLVISILLILALIGYFVDNKRAKDTIVKLNNNSNDINLESLNVEENVTLQSALNQPSRSENDPTKDNPNIV